MALTEQQIRQITDEIVRSLSGTIRAEAAAPAPAPKPQPAESGRWLCDTAEEAVQNAKAAQAKLADMTLEKRGELIAAMRKAGIDNAEYLARLAHEETATATWRTRFRRTCWSAAARRALRTCKPAAKPATRA